MSGVCFQILQQNQTNKQKNVGWEADETKLV